MVFCSQVLHNVMCIFFLGKPIVPPPTSAPVVSKPATIVAPGATSRLIHPDEDISLVRIHPPLVLC